MYGHALVAWRGTVVVSRRQKTAAALAGLLAAIAVLALPPSIPGSGDPAARVPADGGGPPPGSAAVPPPAAHVVRVQVSPVPGCEAAAGCFVPANITIAAGGTVTWVNNGTVSSAVNGGTMWDNHDEDFDSGLLLPGDAFSRTFAEAGTYPYFSPIQPWATGTVSVVAPPAAPP